MRFDDSTKAELHLRCEELRDALWTETEQREETARDRLVSTRRDGKESNPTLGKYESLLHSRRFREKEPGSRKVMT